MDLSHLFKKWGLALTGSICCGKSTVAAILREAEQLVIDADKLSRLVVAPGTRGLSEIIQGFGPEMLSIDGSLNRAKMRQLVFSDSNRRLQLEAIVHPKLNDEVERILIEAGFETKPRLWFYEAALIFERQRQQNFREIWVAFCSESEQIYRLMRRDRCSEPEALAILKAQMSAQEKADRAQVVFDTSCTMPELQAKVKAALRDLSQRMISS